MAKVVRKGLEQKLAALEGAEWDSMSETEPSGDEASDGGELRPPPLPLAKAKANAKGKAGAGASVVPVGPAGEPSGVVFIGHIPHGFYEEAMKGFFSQFGDVLRVRLSKSSRSGRCKGYAYVEFASPEVAIIVAKTMDGYYLADKQLVCRVLRFDEIHPNLFDGAGVKFKKVNWHGLYRQKFNSDRTIDKDEKHLAKLLKKDKAKKDKLAALGIEYDFPGFAASLNNRRPTWGRTRKKGTGAEKRSEDEDAEGAKAASEEVGDKKEGGEKKTTKKGKEKGVKEEEVSPSRSRGQSLSSSLSSSKKAETQAETSRSKGQSAGKAKASPKRAAAAPGAKKSSPAAEKNNKLPAAVEDALAAEEPATVMRSPAAKKLAIAAAAAATAAAVPAAAVPAAAGASPLTAMPPKGGSKSDAKSPASKPKAPATKDGEGGGRSPESAKGKGLEKKGKGAKTPESATAEAADVGADSGGKKKDNRKSPKPAGVGKKRALKDAEAATLSPISSWAGSGKKKAKIVKFPKV